MLYYRDIVFCYIPLKSAGVFNLWGFGFCFDHLFAILLTARMLEISVRDTEVLFFLRS